MIKHKVSKKQSGRSYADKKKALSESLKRQIKGYKHWCGKKRINDRETDEIEHDIYYLNIFQNFTSLYILLRFEDRDKKENKKNGR